MDESKYLYAIKSYIDKMPSLPTTVSKILEICNDPKTSPVTWVVFSQGPDYDAWESLKVKHGPVPRRCWYRPAPARGLIVRMRLQRGHHIGSFNSRAQVEKVDP